MTDHAKYIAVKEFISITKKKKKKLHRDRGGKLGYGKVMELKVMTVRHLV